MHAIEKFVRNLAAFRTSGDLTNHYARTDPELDLPGGAERRCRNLELYLELFAKAPPRFILLGEAAGYRGCRFSGIPFTSEFMLLENAVLKARPFQRTARRPRPWREASACIVWETIALLDQPPLLWGTVPFHPHVAGRPLSNRTPTRAECAQGFAFFLELRQIFPRARLIAAGRLAAQALDSAGIPFAPVRHPAHGGKTAFQSGVRAAYLQPS